jgi:hypothetical protein
MTAHRGPHARTRCLLFAAAILLVGHAVVPYLFVRSVFSATMLSSLIALLVLEHVGLLAAVLGPLASRFRVRVRSVLLRTPAAKK